jgi:hypothetical protein
MLSDTYTVIIKDPVVILYIYLYIYTPPTLTLKRLQLNNR